MTVSHRNNRDTKGERIMAEEAITEDQAAEALQQLTDESVDAEVVADVTPAPSFETEQETDETAEVATEGEVVEESDDLASLRARNEELEAAAKTNEDRLSAIHTRRAESDKIQQDRYLRKSTAADNALRMLKLAQSEEGASSVDVNRVIQEVEGTMNPQSASYVAPTAQVASREEQALLVNNFLNEKGLSQKEAAAFDSWLQTQATTKMSPLDVALADRDVDGFLRLAHPIWEQDVQVESETKRSDAVDAVKSVQRTQRNAAKAASGTTGAPKKSPANPAAEVDVSKLTKADISELVRQSVTQYK